MKKIIIVVRGGMVQEVLCKDKNIEVELLDFDEQDIDRFEEKGKRYNELHVDKSYINIL